MTRILVVDDNPHIRTLVRGILEEAGYDVTEAINGRDGMKCFHDQLFQLVICDIMMPDQDGIEMIGAIREAGHPSKVLAISGGGRTGRLDYLKFAEELGANASLSKPFEPDELLGEVRRLLS